MTYEGEYLYDPRLLNNLDWDSVRGWLNPHITCTEPGESWLLVRPLQLSDYSKGFLEILTQLTAVGNVSYADFERQYRNMHKSGGYYVTVIEDTRTNTIIGAASLISEFKFIHGCGLRARLEDVVVNNTYRGKQLGKLIVVTVTLLARRLGCYKMTLDCKDHLIPFYKAIGYKLEPGNANSMTIRFDETPKIATPS
ncbi:glucosamine 6-phosphate n-acetyltransferase [Holotrichia oblita]|uniref:Glucosamine 6-phosphate n-acetyltransferase n=1 Tax=Holotrichia oblita TaxID=644536 RepID=A0ACB9TQR5_HOLOL|nr:glucosamine 6-phosphate n-acetyltransferase [Holotrichia oblita]